MGSTKYKLAHDVLVNHKGKTMSLSELRLVIMKELGSDERTVKSYLQLMSTTGLTKEIKPLTFVILPTET